MRISPHSRKMEISGVNTSGQMKPTPLSSVALQEIHEIRVAGSQDVDSAASLLGTAESEDMGKAHDLDEARVRALLGLDDDLA